LEYLSKSAIWEFVCPHSVWGSVAVPIMRCMCVCVGGGGAVLVQSGQDGGGVYVGFGDASGATVSLVNVTANSNSAGMLAW
jgi:hypothetical protein